MNKPNKVEFCKRCVISNYRPSSVVEFENKTGDSKEYIQFKNIRFKYSRRKRKCNKILNYAKRYFST